MPMFSIVVVHFQGTISREIYLRGVNSLLAQTFKDYEILVYHDGPLVDPDAPSPVPIRCTERRFNDWGHTLRDRGIRQACGEYILHFNADNVLYPNCLGALADATKEPSRIFNQAGQAIDNPNLLIFPIILHDHMIVGTKLARMEPGSGVKMIMTGLPVIPNMIDCMQLVMKRSLWLAEGGWVDRSHDGDGLMYQRLANKYGYRCLTQVLGEHY